MQIIIMAFNKIERLVRRFKSDERAVIKLVKTVQDRRVPACFCFFDFQRPGQGQTQKILIKRPRLLRNFCI